MSEQQNVSGVFLGKRLKFMRTNRGFTQHELARHCEIDQRSISLLESGKVINPHKSTVSMLNSIFNVESNFWYDASIDVPGEPKDLGPSLILSEQVQQVVSLINSTLGECKITITTPDGYTIEVEPKH